jgi:uncharacterized protein
MLAPALALAVAVSASTTFARSEMEQGWAAYARGDYAQAAQIIRPFAEEGDPEAQFKLGRMYHHGQGVPKDNVQAVKWYTLSAEAGLPFAQNNLGVMYKNGWGVQQDYVKAYMWFDLAARYYFDFEEMNLERARQNKQDILANMTPAQIAQARALAENWAPKQSALGASTKLIGH